MWKQLTRWLRLQIGDTILTRKDGILRKQSPSGDKSMDHNDSSYEWNYKDSMRNQIGNNKYIIRRVTPFSEELLI